MTDDAAFKQEARHERNLYVAISVALLATSFAAVPALLLFFTGSLAMDLVSIETLALKLVFIYLTLRLAWLLGLRGWVAVVLVGLAMFPVLDFIVFVILVIRATRVESVPWPEERELATIRRVGNVVALVFGAISLAMWWSIASSTIGSWVRFLALPIVLPTLPVVCLLLLGAVPRGVWWAWPPMMVGLVLALFAEKVKENTAW